jgi:hypothetical protein
LPLLQSHLAQGHALPRAAPIQWQILVWAKRFSLSRWTWHNSDGLFYPACSLLDLLRLLSGPHCSLITLPNYFTSISLLQVSAPGLLPSTYPAYCISC